MRAYLLRLLSISLFSAVFEFLLPSGKVRRFAAPLLSLAVTASVLLPCISLFSGSGEALYDLLPQVEAAASESAYETKVAEEYVRRIEASIEKFGDATAEVSLGKNFSVSRIVLSGNVTNRMMHYITMELEVPRSCVEIR